MLTRRERGPPVPMENIRIDARRVEEIFLDCLFRDKEIDGEGKPRHPDMVVMSEGIKGRFGLHKKRLERYYNEIEGMLYDLDPVFYEPNNLGNGESFQKFSLRQDGEPWGTDREAEMLMVLGIGLKLVKNVLPRQLWAKLPGGMPYISITFPQPLPTSS